MLPFTKIKEVAPSREEAWRSIRWGGLTPKDLQKVRD